MSETQDYFATAQESLAGAESELAHRRFNNCVRSAYYACFQAAIVALLNEGIALWRFLKKNSPIQVVEAGRIRISHLGNSGWRSKRASTACIAFFPRDIPF